MQNLSLDQLADLLTSATLDKTLDVGHAIVHIGVSEAGHQFVLVNSCDGTSAVSYSPL